MKTLFKILIVVFAIFAIAVIATFSNTAPTPQPNDNFVQVPNPTYTVPAPQTPKEPLPERTPPNPISVSPSPAVIEPPTVEESPIVTSLSAEQIALDIHDLVNQYRTNPSNYHIQTEEGTYTVFVIEPLPALDWDSELANIALAHSEDMAENDYFEHEDQRGRDPTERARKAGYRCYEEVKDVTYGDNGAVFTETTVYEGVGENLFWADGYSSEEIAKLTVDSWLLSPGHRENIEDQHVKSEGIGVAFIGNAVYVTQDLC
jgi:uncharacterized protein YkwD